ncbi:hypothetical protein Scep_024000 [Stephania cephalantha]|uniref:Uncharacterized protein n=1 Tax=Stephania cephalantha TaxID=152367 RepID=A0AAP0EVQ0_9MAGN
MRAPIREQHTVRRTRTAQTMTMRKAQSKGARTEPQRSLESRKREAEREAAELGADKWTRGAKNGSTTSRDGVNSDEVLIVDGGYSLKEEKRRCRGSSRDFKDSIAVSIRLQLWLPLECFLGLQLK